MLKWRRRRDTPHRRKQNKRQERHRHPPFRSGWRLPRLSRSSPAVDQRRERGSHATETGAPHRGIYSRPAQKVQEGGHACFCFHSPGTFTRPHMWVLNIYPNTRSNIVWAEREEAVGSPRKRSWRESGGRLGRGEEESKEIKVVIRRMKVCASKPWRGLKERGLGTVTGPRWGIKGLTRWGKSRQSEGAGEVQHSCCCGLLNFKSGSRKQNPFSPADSSLWSRSLPLFSPSLSLSFLAWEYQSDFITMMKTDPINTERYDEYNSDYGGSNN